MEHEGDLPLFLKICLLFINFDKDKMRSHGDYLVSIIGMGVIGIIILPLDVSLPGATKSKNI